MDWTQENRLKLNCDKVEFIVLPSDRLRDKVTSTGISVEGIRVKAADKNM